ncbi:MAG: M23 family metallopeptidase [Tissierellia bacterium]|jgi:murein DD-endopeptidase MepM/ murein hydrolase activator NlpD|nr:M23 family metallopeptidase [Tissierellia bacterium]MDD3226472.1 M23 family metallopeptidase [Tissierellia bacterium]MDD3750760.1 M23 family metallopeptidase [Tissierellia bacterium]MDD4046272.1 M23 family metallopeptidase [Tissierellia bacterium]
MNKPTKKRFNIKRKEQLNKKLALQVIFSIVLVAAVIVTKNINSDLSERFIEAADEKMSASIELLEVRDTIAQGFSAAINKLPFVGKKEATPVIGTLYRKYGLNKTDDVSYYNHGIDIKTETQSVKALTEGKVMTIGNNEKLSGYIVIQNEDRTLIYGKINETFVKEGDNISKGDVIGALNEENMILHIEVWEDGASLNPSSLFDLTE